MTGDVVNLRMARKAKARADASAKAATNRAKYGEPAALRKARETEAARARSRLDGARREPD